MPNSYVKPFEAQVTAKTIAMNCGLIDLTQYVERPGTDPTYCEYENAGSTAKLGEVISVKVFQTNATSLSKTVSAKSSYPRQTKKGYQFVVKHEYLERVTTPDGKVYDEPVSIYLVGKTTNGSSMVTSADWFDEFSRLAGTMFAVNADQTAFEVVHPRIEKILRGFTRVLS